MERTWNEDTNPASILVCYHWRLRSLFQPKPADFRSEGGGSIARTDRVIYAVLLAIAKLGADERIAFARAQWTLQKQ
jgi:hypothetical protein